MICLASPYGIGVAGICGRSASSGDIRKTPSIDGSPGVMGSPRLVAIDPCCTPVGGKYILLGYTLFGPFGAAFSGSSYKIAPKAPHFWAFFT